MSIFDDMPSEKLIPPAPRDPDTVRLMVTVHVDREGLRQWRSSWPGAGLTPFEVLEELFTSEIEWASLGEVIEAVRI